MAQGALVEIQIEGGQKLLDQAASAGFEVTAGFWLRPSEDGEWTLYIASRVFNEKGPAQAYRALNEAFRHLKEPGFSLLDIKAIGAGDPIVKDVQKIQQRYSGRPVIHFGGARLGGLDIEEAYIYSQTRNSGAVDEQWRGMNIMVFPEPAPPDAFFVEFWPQELALVRGLGGEPRKVPRPAGVRIEGGQVAWYRPPEKPTPHLQQENYERKALEAVKQQASKGNW